MREEVRDWLFLMGKSVLFVIGGVCVMAGAVDLVVDGVVEAGRPNWTALGVLALGLLLAVPPLAFAFRDALREARKARREG